MYHVMYLVSSTVLAKTETVSPLFLSLTPKFLKSLQALSETTEDYEALVSPSPSPKSGNLIGSVLFLTCWPSLHD